MTLVLLLISIDTMRKQIHVSLSHDESARLEVILNGRTVYAFALAAIREKLQREGGRIGSPNHHIHPPQGLFRTERSGGIGLLGAGR